MRQEHRRRRGAPSTRRQRAGVAMRHHAHRARAPLRDAAQDADAVLADRMVHRDVLGDDGVGLGPRGVGAICGGASGATFARTRSSAQRRLTAVGRVASSAVKRGGQRAVRGIAVERKREAVGADRADQRRAANPHVADRERCGVRVAILMRTSACGSARWSMTSTWRAPRGRTSAR